MKIQMSQIYRNCRNTENIINVSIPSKFNKQMQGSDCGLFAIANLVEYCFGRYDEIIKGGTIGWEFKQCETRGHLVKCLQNLQFQPFPKVQKRRAIKIIHVAYDLKVWCVCGMPEEYGDMICCGRFEKLFHGLCVGAEMSMDMSWECTICK